MIKSNSYTNVAAGDSVDQFMNDILAPYGSMECIALITKVGEGKYDTPPTAPSVVTGPDDE